MKKNIMKKLIILFILLVIVFLTQISKLQTSEIICKYTSLWCHKRLTSPEGTWLFSINNNLRTELYTNITILASWNQNTLSDLNYHSGINNQFYIPLHSNIEIETCKNLLFWKIGWNCHKKIIDKDLIDWADKCVKIPITKLSESDIDPKKNCFTYDIRWENKELLYYRITK